MPKEEGYKGSEPDASTRQVAELLTSILKEVRQQVARGAPGADHRGGARSAARVPGNQCSTAA